MHIPYPFNPGYTMNWFLLSLINHHLNQLLARYARLQVLRVDLFYKTGSWRFSNHSWHDTQREVRALVEKVMLLSDTVGYFWVLETTHRHGCHAHIVFYLNGHTNQATYPVAERVCAVWQDITEHQGYYNRCEYKPSYVADIDIDEPVNYNDEAGVNGLRYIISYLAKEEQKGGQYIWGYNDVPQPSGLGRPRRQ